MDFQNHHSAHSASLAIQWSTASIVNCLPDEASRECASDSAGGSTDLLHINIYFRNNFIFKFILVPYPHFHVVCFTASHRVAYCNGTP
jgi:hypothetical protein